MKRILVVAAVAASVALAVACGGASDSELFASPGSSEFGTLPSGDDPSGTSSGSTSGGGSSGLSGSGSSTSSSGGSTSGGSSGTNADAGASDAGPAKTGIWCGKDNDGDNVYCASGTVCCSKQYGPGGPSKTCSGAGPFAGCPNNGIPIGCDDKSDCPSGQVCCGTFEENSGYHSVQCMPTCTAVGNNFRAVRFCDPNAAVDECAAIGRKCGWSQSLVGYGICK